MTLEEIKVFAQQIIDDNEKEVMRWKSGEKGLMKFLSDQVVIKTSYKAHPKLAIIALNDLMKD